MFRPLVLAWLLLSLSLPRLLLADPAPLRTRENVDSAWRFSLGHATDTARDFDFATAYFNHLTKAGYADGPASPKFDDRAWRLLDLPHDWAVELPFAADGSHSHGYKAIGHRYPENSVGWYRRHLAIPASARGQRISIEFDGIFRDAQVFLNGFYLGHQPSGYTGVSYDLTDYLNYGGDNILVVRADASLEEGWYYEGAGIYRHVWLTTTAPLHVAHWGVFASSELEPGLAHVSVRTRVVNESSAEEHYTVEQTILGPDGGELARVRGAEQTLAAGATAELSQTLELRDPHLWSLEDPALHQVVTRIYKGTTPVDATSTVLGLRSLRFDPDQGFFLNGKHVIVQGVNMHQDHAGVGVAVPDALLEFRIRRLKEMGANAYRTSHHPPAPELLDICDRLGFLVLDENRLMGPSPEQLSQLEAMILRDRNHPSVFIWSLGNEEWQIEGNDFGARITASMRAVAERLDPTRRTTVAISGGWGAGSSTTADVMGYNYYTHGSTDAQHAAFPRQPSLGTEETTDQCTRGVYVTDKALGHQAHDPHLIGDSGANCMAGWKHYVARPYVAGLFFWTGFDYRGEPNPYTFPAHSSQFGLMDTCGFAKDAFFYLKSWWTTEPVLHLSPHWNWPGREGQPIHVVCYSNHDEVELLLNGRSLGRRAMPRNELLEWDVAYQPGVLEARGFRQGVQVGNTQVLTTGKAAALVLHAERAELKGDGRDLTVVTVSAVDAAGHAVPDASLPVQFRVTGGRLLGVGNGDPSSLEPDQFHDSVQAIPVGAWRALIRPAGSSALAGAGLEPLQKVGDWQAPLPKPGELYELSAELPLSQVPAAGLELFLPPFGTQVRLWVNGREVALSAAAASQVDGPALHLAAEQLRAGVNRLQLLVTPLEGNARRLPQIERLGCARLLTPAAQPARRLFNGLAQLIIQAGTQPGILRIDAEAEGLPAVSLQVKVK